MKLQEVCSATGLTKKTIRFYEEKQLITPTVERRNGRNYREYTQTDVDTLLEIATLRKAWFTIEEIHRMQEEPDAIRDIFPQYRQWLRQQKAELELLLAVAEQIDAEKVCSVHQLTETMSDAAAKLPLPPVDVKPRFRYLDELETRPAVVNDTNYITKVMPGNKVQRQLAVYGSGDSRDAPLMAADIANETAYMRKQPESAPVSGAPKEKPRKLQTWQRRLLIVSLTLVLLSAFMPRIYVLSEEYPALCCSNEAYDTLTEEFSTVTVRISGFYLSTPIGNDRFYGTIQFLDYPKAGKTSSGKFEPMELGRIWNNVHRGELWYYSDKRNRYGSLGTIFWDVLAEHLFIHTDEDYIVYPAASVADVDTLWLEMTPH